MPITSLPKQWSIGLVGSDGDTFANQMFSELQIEFTSQNGETATWVSDGPDYDSDTTFDPLDRIQISGPDNRRLFVGVITQVPREGAPEAERHRYRAEGPSWYLKKVTFQANRVFAANQNSPATTATQLWSDVILNMKTNGARATVKEQITAIVQYAITCQTGHAFDNSGPGAKIAIGDIILQVPGVASTDVIEPYNQVRAITCFQAIREELRLLPDAVISWDMTTDPPKFQCKSSSQQQSLIIDLPPPLTDSTVQAAAARTVEHFDITSREDQQIGSCIIQYLVTSVIDGKNYLFPIYDIAPPGSTGQERNAMVAMIDIRGPRISTTTAEIVVEAINATDPDWWRTRMPELADQTRYANLTLNAASLLLTSRFGDDLSGFGNEIVKGQPQGWMPFDFARGNAVIDSTYQLTDTGGNVLREPIAKALRDKVIFTDAPIGTNRYSRRTTVDPGENAPVGLAAYMYAALSKLYFDGTISLVAEECFTNYFPGQNLSFTGGRPEWANAQIPIQSVALDVENGRTTITFGFPSHLGVQDLVDWLRGLRPIQRQSTQQEVTDGFDDSSDQALGDDMASEDSGLGHSGDIRAEYRNDNGANTPYVRIDTRPSSGGGSGGGTNNNSQVIVLDPNSGTEKSVTIATIDCVDTDGNFHKLKVRQYVCSGSKNAVLLVGSEVYQLKNAAP